MAELQFEGCKPEQCTPETKFQNPYAKKKPSRQQQKTLEFLQKL